MNSSVIIGNLCTLLAMGSNAISSTQKTAKGVLGVQSLSQIIYCAGAIMLKGYSAAVQNAVSILRNLAAIRNINNKFVEWILIGFGVVLGIAFNNRGVIGLLPVVGNLQYTLVIFRFKDNERALKLSFLISVAAFAVFNAAIFNFAGAVSDLVVIITTVVALVKSAKNET